MEVQLNNETKPDGLHGHSLSGERVQTTASSWEGEPVFFVLRIDFVSGPDTATLFVNPTLGVEPTAGGVSVTDLDLNTLTRLQVEQPNGTTLIFDEFRFGNSYSDVTPFTAVP